MENSKVLIAAMSGGVDSSVAAAMYLQQGYKVIGVTLKLKDCDLTREKTKSCCSLEDNRQVKQVAEILGITHKFLPLREEFEDKVLKRAWNDYRSGRTPNPCVMCNHFCKFGSEMKRFAEELGACGIITGHYAIIDRTNPEKAKLFKGANHEKDQTYFLSGLTQDQLNMCYMPLGNMDKSEVRAIADKLGLPNSKKTESQDACFGYKGETFAETLSRYFNDTPGKGEIVDENGKILVKHNGIQYFTIGQRKGLGVALGKPAYVVKIDKATNRVVVSTNYDKLMSQEFYASEMNWIDFDFDELKCEVQTRYRQPLQKALVVKQGDKAFVKLDEPLASITPGQRLAIFKDGQLLGGGWID